VPGPRRSQFQYAIIRIVPDIVRGECLNVGVVLLSRPKRYLGARTGLDPARLAAIAPGVTVETILPHLEAIERIAAGDPAAGPIGQLGPAERFHWLVAPSSTMLQPSAAHTGLCRDPETELEHLFETLVT
jgi:hypothetical protein